ncbi:MAG: hypothetical protein PHO76_11815 [Methylotenera sp.]|nr:hypothetical protein [Methylotenera sp.]MDD4925485.1 hypothetical protein [Methylotenera sp.]
MPDISHGYFYRIVYQENYAITAATPATHDRPVFYQHDLRAAPAPSSNGFLQSGHPRRSPGVFQYP